MQSCESGKVDLFNPPFRLPREEAVGLMAQMIEAVAELEKHHIAHRDIKPSNFLVRRRSSLNNADFLNGEC